MSAYGLRGSRRRKRQAVPELPPEDDSATIVRARREEKQEMCGSAAEIEQQDEAYVVVVKEEVVEEGAEGQMDAEYLESEDEQYPEYNPDQPFFLHIPAEVKQEYDEDIPDAGDATSEFEMIEQADEEYLHEDIDYETEDTNDATEDINDSTEDINYVTDDTNDTTEDINYVPEDTNDTTEDTLVRSRGKPERWICGSSPNEKRLLELMLAPPPPLPKPIPYFKDGKLYRCKTCSFSHLQKSHCIRHYREKHGPRYIYCFACGSTFTQAAGLYKHEMKMLCKAPGIQIIRRLRRASLQKQEWRKRCGHSQYYRSLCSECGVDCGTVEDLKKHKLREHATVRRFRCKHCPATYTIQSSLASHMRKHAKEKSVCYYCGKAFIKKDSLFVHLKTHGEKRFKCGYCPQGFTQKRSLLAHEARHTGAPPPHPCQFCTSGFWRSDFLKSHMESVHGYSIITKKKLRQMLPHMTSDEIKDSMQGEGWAILDSTPRHIFAPQPDHADEMSRVEELLGFKKSPETKSFKIKSLRDVKKSLEVRKSSGVQTSSEVKKSPGINSTKDKKSPGVKNSPVHKKSPLDNASKDGKLPTSKKRERHFKRSAS